METIFYNDKGIRSGWRLLAWFGLSLVGLLFLVIVIVSMGILPLNRSTLSEERLWTSLFMDWPMFLVIFVAAAIIAVKMEDRPISSLGFLFHSRWQRELLQGLGLGIGMVSGLFLLLVCLGAYHVNGLQANLFSVLGSLLMSAVLFLGLALFEEFFQRGYLLQNLIDGLGLPAAATLSCLLFGAMHLINPGENPAGIAAVLLAGILFVILAVRTRCLWLAVGFHAAWDWAHFLYGLPCSGIMLHGGLLRVTTHGPDWLTGGTVGLEGSTLTLLLLALAIPYCARARWIRPNPDAALLWAAYVSPRE